MCDGIGYPPHFAEPRAAYAPRPSGVPFPLGRVLATPGALALAEEHGLDLPALIARHQLGDWGDVPHADALANDIALDLGTRLFSAYATPAGRLWIITEADRSATTVLLPDEY